MTDKSYRARVVLVLHMAFQDGIDQHDGAMRYMMENGLDWDIRIDRMTPTWDRPRTSEIQGFDGAIVSYPEPALAKRYAESEIPLVAIDWQDDKPLSKRQRTVHITSDAGQIGKAAADEILKIGDYESVAFLPVDGSIGWSEGRYEAFTRQMAEHGIDVIRMSLRGSLEKQLRRLPKPAAVFAANDVVAAKALAAARNDGIPVPLDLSVLGVDNERLTCLHARPPLASIQPDFEESGYMAAAALHAMMSGKRVATRQKYGVRGVVLRRSMEPSGTAGRLVQRAKEIIHDTCLSAGGIDAIAERLGVSRRLLDRRFRQIEGKSVLEEIQGRRIEEACRLLRTTAMSIAEICTACSFGSGTYPMRLFKRRMGMTMRAYRIAGGFYGKIRLVQGDDITTRKAFGK